MKDVCVDCDRTSYCLEPCEQWLIQHDKCPVCQNKLIHAGGCTECITGDWAKCGQYENSNETNRNDCLVYYGRDTESNKV